PNKPGKDGEVGVQYINMGKSSDHKWNELDSKTKKSYPLAVINIIRREAEDLLLSNSNDNKGRDALKFILSLTNERSDLQALKKDVQQKLVFLGQDGYDIFGKNDMFAPRVKWQSLEKSVEEIKTAAESYENAFNDIISTIEKGKNFKKIASRMSAVVGLHVNAEKKRLEEAKLSAESEKTTYVKSIEYLEEQMSSIIQEVTSELPGVYKKAKFNSQNLIGMLQGLVGFAAAGAAKDPFALIDQTLALAEESSQRCHLKSLDSYLGSIKQWLTFGKHYKPLVDSSELDFDQMNVSSVPQIMQANLEINKEKFASELVCLLDDNSLPQDVAVFKQLLESFFIAGAARIDLIAEIMNLDNDIGGYNFDIPLLDQTEQAIKEATTTKESYCVSEDDSRWVAMCNHALNKRGSHSKDALLGMEECQSPFGIYELKIPIDNKLACDTNRITTTNCKDLDLTKFTQMNVWTHYVFWDGEYPKSPGDIVCRKSQQKKRNETATAYQESNVILDAGDYF
ncbi:unnamed protein product, partial [Porites lobata]